jgi:hypothetical protein
MAVFQEKCWPCGKQCINTEFCGIDNTYQLPRNIKVKVIANPDFWGFGGTVIEGYAHFDNSHYDFFDGFDEDHKAYDVNGYGPFNNETRPDVNYRSVYDPDDASVLHYGADGEEDGVDRGGAEVYLIDRESQNTSDSAASETTRPDKVFKWWPEKFGFGTKIHFHNNIYKNITGAWRLIDATGCYDDNFTTPGGAGAYLHQCTGIDKQDIRIREHSEGTYLQYNEPGRTRPIQSGMHFGDCFADGQIAPEYSGELIQLVRGTGNSPLVATLNYDGGTPTALRNGMELLLTNDVDKSYNKAYRIFNVAGANVSLVGTYDSGNSVDIDTSGNGSWVAFGTHDPKRCCGGAAYGIDDDCKWKSKQFNYHTDFRRVFNNPKNLRQSNRKIENRETHGLTNPVQVKDSGFRFDYTYPSVKKSGESGIPDVSVTGNVPQFSRSLPYYGPFHLVDKYDIETRFDQVKNSVKGRNATCYSKKASLEIFPGCLTQYEAYQNCDPRDVYKRNSLPRLTFVYRGCNYDEICSFDESGRPLGDSDIYGGWTTSGPGSLADIKRGLPGQEITMYINLEDVWGGEYKRCPCCCPPADCPGNDPPQHITIESPITFPCFPDFDKYPVANGCKDKRYQFSQYAEHVEQIGASDLAHELCDALPDLDAACNIRQPYVTYGHISHLCGWESGNAKTTLTNAFAKERQGGEYTQRTPESGNVNEPMYWAFECPSPKESGVPVNNGTWSGSGETGDNAITNVSGEFYPYWGLTDGAGRLTAPYFHVIEQEVAGCCGASDITILNYDSAYTFFNGWPSGDVPFLIELETTDNCVGCATTVMETGALTLSFSGLPASFLHDVTTDGYPTEGKDSAYGFHHCAYRGTKLTPNFNCESGFGTKYCNSGSFEDIEDEAFYLKYGSAEIGNTCECIGGTDTPLFNVELNPIIIEDSDDIIIGWSTVPATGFGHGFIEIPNCNNIDSKFLEFDYFETPGIGYTTYGKFSVACEENIDTIDKPSFPNAYYETSAVNNLYACGGCTHKQPAQIGGQGNLVLKSEFMVVSNINKDTFEAMNSDYIDGVAANRGGSYTDTYGDGWYLGWPNPGDTMTVCSGDKILQYGCLLSDGFFYGCSTTHPLASGGACYENTLCNTCPVECSCDDEIFLSYTDSNGFTSKRYPPEFDLFPGCYCDCQTPTLMRILDVTSDSPGPTFTESWRHASACDNSVNNFAKWFAVSGEGRRSTPEGYATGPILYSQLPPAPYLGYREAATYSKDWFSYSQGVNKIAGGIDYRLQEPTQGNCGMLDPQTCGTGACTIDRRAKSANCLDPIAYTSNGTTWEAANFDVNKKYCYPEVMVVSKIECVTGGGYDLTVSREYHEHDRTWRQPGSTDCSCLEMFIGAYKYPKLVYATSGTGASGQFTVDVGGTGHFNVTASGSNYVYGGTAQFPTCVSGSTSYPCCTGLNQTPTFTPFFSGGSLSFGTVTPATGYAPTGTICNISITPTGGLIVYGSGCTTIPYAVISDSVTPAYQGPCSINPSSGTYTPQDFKLKTPDDAPVGADPVWNYYNLFYKGDSAGKPPVVGAVNTYESGEYYSNLPISTDSDIGCGPDCDNPDPSYSTDILLSQPLFNTPSGRFGVDATNRHHSCLQDITQCGGELWCNKLFFPRRSYKVNTKIAPFGSSQICTQNAQFLNRTEEGYLDLWLRDKNVDILDESKFYRYIDLCDPQIIATAQSQIGIDDVVIRVDDYLRLMGVVHPGWRYTLDMKSCTVVETGDCGGTLPPTHSDSSIDAGSHQPKTWLSNGWESMGYYLDKDGVSDPTGSGIGASGADNCLFNPFKIMVDVECSTNNIKRRGIETDDPTLLDTIIDIPSVACKGTINPPPCGCNDSVCNTWQQRPHDHCKQYYAINAVWEPNLVGYVCPTGGGSVADDILCTIGQPCVGVGTCTPACNTGPILNGETPGAMADFLFGQYVLSTGGAPGPMNPFTPIMDASVIVYDGKTYAQLIGLDLLGGPTSDVSHDVAVCVSPSNTEVQSLTGARVFDPSSGPYYTWCDTKTVVEITGPFELPVWECNLDNGDSRWLARTARPRSSDECCEVQRVGTNEGLCAQTHYVNPDDIACADQDSVWGSGGLIVLDNWPAVTATTWGSGCGCDKAQLQDFECKTDSKARVTITQTPTYNSVVTPPPYPTIN